MAKKTEEKKEKKQQHPNSLKNLIPLNQRTPKQRKEIATMGAIAANAKIKKRKTFREIIEALGVSEATETEKQKFLQMFPDADPNEITKDMMLIASLYNQGIGRGNVKAAAMIRDTAGEKPSTTINGTLTTEKVFITPEEQKKVEEHINSVICESIVDNTEKE